MINIHYKRGKIAVFLLIIVISIIFVTSINMLDVRDMGSWVLFILISINLIICIYHIFTFPLKISLSTTKIKLTYIYNKEKEILIDKKNFKAKEIIKNNSYSYKVIILKGYKRNAISFKINEKNSGLSSEQLMKNISEIFY